MTRALIVANDVIGARMAGPGIRAWEISGALHRAGIDVTLAAPGSEVPTAPFATLAFDVRGDALRRAAEGADAIMVQGLVLAHYPFLAALDVPLVVDAYDPFVLENLQARADQTLSGRERHHATDLEAMCGQLRRGDFFVCASEVQRNYWLGMLTALGRVNPANYDADASLRRLIDIVPFGLPGEPPRSGGPAMRGVVPGIGADDVVVLWNGGIWNWFDPLTLIRAVGAVAAERPELRLVFMGTQTPSPYVPEMEMANAAESLARELGLLDSVVFFNRGWVPYDERAGYLLEADLVASCHLEHIETAFAFRTRLLDGIWAGVPMLVTEGDVLADLIAAEGLGLTVPAEDVDAVADALRRLMTEIGSAEGRSGYEARFDTVRPQLAWDVAVGPLLAFLRAPDRAPDRPEADAETVQVTPTSAGQLPRRALEITRDGGPLMLAEEAIRYLRWLRRGRA